MRRKPFIRFTLGLSIICATQAPAQAVGHSNFHLKVVTSTCSKSEISGGEAHIKKQMSAFKSKNLSKAYSYASKEFKVSKSSKQFEEIIQTNYPMLIGHKNYSITYCDKSSQLYMFILNLVDSKNASWEVRYLLSNFKGIWGVEAAAAAPIDTTKLKP